jgi:hypothetical protein
MRNASRLLLLLLEDQYFAGMVARSTDDDIKI